MHPNGRETHPSTASGSPDLLLGTREVAVHLLCDLQEWACQGGTCHRWAFNTLRINGKFAVFAAKLAAGPPTTGGTSTPRIVTAAHPVASRNCFMHLLGKDDGQDAGVAPIDPIDVPPGMRMFEAPLQVIMGLGFLCELRPRILLLSVDGEVEVRPGHCHVSVGPGGHRILTATLFKLDGGDVVSFTGPAATTAGAVKLNLHSQAAAGLYRYELNV